MRKHRPGRHVKEGFSLLQVTKTATCIRLRATLRAKDVILRRYKPQPSPSRTGRFASKLSWAPPAGRVDRQLSRQQLADLIRYLAEQGRNWDDDAG